MTDEEPRGTPRELTNRVRRLSGQVAGIERMLASGAPCRDLIQQVRAAEGALRSLKKRIVEHHYRDCTRRLADAEDRGDRRDLLEELEGIVALERTR